MPPLSGCFTIIQKTIDEASKKSIHARLQEKKNELAKKPEKDNPQRGVELA